MSMHTHKHVCTNEYVYTHEHAQICIRVYTIHGRKEGREGGKKGTEEERKESNEGRKADSRHQLTVLL